MSVMAYYLHSAEEAIYLAWMWAVGQGLWLTIWLGFAGASVEAVRHECRARRGQSMKGWRNAAREFSVAFGGGLAVFMIGLFLFFFMEEAPKQISDLQHAINEYHAEIQNLNANIASLHSEVDALQKQGRSDLRVVGRTETAPDSAGNFRTHIVLQTFIRTQPTSIRLELSGEPTACSWHFDYGQPSFGSGSTQFRSGSFAGDNGCIGKTFDIDVSYPPFVPDTPIIVDMVAKSPIRAIAAYFANAH